MRKIHRVLTFLVGAAAGASVFCAGARQAHADDNKQKIAAEALFDQGNRMMLEGRYDEACAKFEASQRLDAGIGTLLYLGDCYERAGKLASAWAIFREADSTARASGQSERAQIASARARALERRLAKVAIVVLPDDHLPGLEVRFAGTVIPPTSLGEYLPSDPGEQFVVVRAPGYRDFRKAVQVSGSGSRYRVVVPRLEPIPEQSQTQTKSGLKTAGVVTASAGLLGLGAGAVLGVMAAETNKNSLEYCPAEPDLCTPKGVELREQAGDYADAATASLVAGGGLLLTGVVLYAVAPSSSPKERAAKAQSEPALKMTPLVAKRGLEFSVRGHF